MSTKYSTASCIHLYHSFIFPAKKRTIPKVYQKTEQKKTNLAA